MDKDIKYYLKKALDYLFLVSPAATSLGVILGITANSFLPVISPVIQKTTNMDFSMVPIWGWVGVGVFTCNVIAYPFRHKLSREVVQAMDIIDKANISQIDKKQAYRNLISKYVDNVGLNQETQKELEELTKKDD